VARTRRFRLTSFEHELEKMIESLVEDRIHGADWLSNEALKIMKEVSLHAPADTAMEMISVLKAAAGRLVLARPSMASLTNKLSKFMFEVTEDEVSQPELRRRMAVLAGALIAESSEARRRAVEHTVALLEGCGCVFTCSYSSTVVEVLSQIPDMRVLVPESRPLFEGRKLARELAERGLKVTLFVDAAMAFFVREADTALVGADSVLANGSIVNKVGTNLLALAVGDAGVPFYVVCDTSKFDVMNFLGRPPALEEKEPSEVVEAIRCVRVRNPYFEVTPARLIAAVVTECGEMKVEDIRRRMEQMRIYVESLMSSVNG
jgi:ribose 1,5-bisphosphate isomerase